ncbi:EAL domain-containing protein [Metabacillus herbersteinensis]|uniref:EAL domain-containing protein n=1 Tax=Metabacillus herbersteinensis TaxID=283816 RepID=A0ABV6GE40_9BACI
MNIVRTTNRDDLSSLKEEFNIILKDKRLTIHFQPIVHFKNARIFGYEALSRGLVDSYFHSPSHLFPFAENEGLLYTLEKMARECAFDESKTIS